MGSILEGNKRSSEASSIRDLSSSLVQGWSESPDRLGGELPPQFRRPFGCAVLELSQLRTMAAEGLEISPTREHTMPIYVPVNEATFSMLHSDILHGHHKEYEKSSRYVAPMLRSGLVN